ncbi:MAG: helix-hairpin-helix domain-containing protein [Chthoniobacterales bacterium]
MTSARGFGAAFIRLALACAPLLFATAAYAREPWQVWKDCRLIQNDSNDGDSFHIQAAGKEYLVRLYFVDAAETDMSFPERIKEQAKYFGVSNEQAVAAGEAAEKFTLEKLAPPFTVRTCMQGAMGRSNMPRVYAFVETTEGDLAELLVANGLARVHGSAAAPVGLSSPELEWQKLQRLESEAKAQKVGGWGAAAGRLSVRLSKQPPKSGADSFDAFFHPERAKTKADAPTAAAPTQPPPKTTGTSPVVTAPGAVKLDVNAAPLAELLNIPGVGPVTAQRIIEARPFKSADDLRNVKGVGAKKFEKLRPFFL